MPDPTEKSPPYPVASFLTEVMRQPIPLEWLDEVTPSGGTLNVFADASRERESGGYVAFGSFALDDRHVPAFVSAMTEEKARLRLAGHEIKFAKRKSIGAHRLSAFLRRAADFPSAIILWLRCLDDEHGQRYRLDAARAAAERSKNAVLIAGLHAESLIGTAVLLSNAQRSIALWPDRNSFPEQDDELVTNALGLAGDTIRDHCARPPAGLFIPDSKGMARAQSHDSVFELGRAIADLAAGVTAKFFSGGLNDDDDCARAIVAALGRTPSFDQPALKGVGLVHQGYRVSAVPNKAGHESLRAFRLGAPSSANRATEQDKESGSA